MSTLLTGEELAELVGVSAVTIRRYARDGLIPARVSPGGHRKYEMQSALEALERLRGGISVESVPVDASDGESFDVPPTPRGAFIRMPARVTVRSVAPPFPHVLSSSEWDDLVQVLDEQF
jgi:MerR family regulatory protein